MNYLTTRLKPVSDFFGEREKNTIVPPPSEPAAARKYAFTVNSLIKCTSLANRVETFAKAIKSEVVSVFKNSYAFDLLEYPRVSGTFEMFTTSNSLISSTNLASP